MPHDQMCAEARAAGFRTDHTGRRLGALLRHIADPHQLDAEWVPGVRRRPDALHIHKRERIVVCIEATVSSPFDVKADGYSILAGLLDEAYWSMAVIEVRGGDGWRHAGIVSAFWQMGRHFRRTNDLIARLPWGAIREMPWAWSVAMHGRKYLGHVEAA